MQNPSTIRTDNQPRVFGHVTPEIADVLRTLKASEFRLEAEYFNMDWESRLELADELRDLCDILDDEQADVIARVAEDLSDEGEDFSAWDTRTAAARRVRLVIHSLNNTGKEATANVF